MKTVLFVPGYREHRKSRDYTSTIHAIKKQGYKVKFIPINWERSTIDDWQDELMRTYVKYDPADTILAGFSFGAMTAVVAAAKRTPSQLWLFSLSGYFHEDIKSKHMRKSWLHNLGHRRVAAFDKLIYREIAPTINCKVLLFAGDIEMNKWPTMNYRTNEAPKFLPDATLTIIRDVGHDVSDMKYISAIKQFI